MKGGLIAGLHALAVAANTGWRPVGDIVIQIVSSEEDGGLGTFAGLSADENFAAAIIPEPTGMRVVCAHAGSQHFRGAIRGKAAHAALRLDGSSAIDRYLPVHEAMREHERVINSEIHHPLLEELALPCPIEIGQLEAGSWSAGVPDLLRFTGRLGFPIGVSEDVARVRFEDSLNAALEGSGPMLELEWPAGFAPGETSGDHPFVAFVSECLASEREGAVSGPEAVPWGADMHQYTSRGIPCAMLGPTGIERAHATDEAVEIADLVELARVFVRIFMGFGQRGIE
jgi:acetylornithine deacetylase